VLRTSTALVVLASAGVGATPLLAMLHALASARSEREVWWLHTARNGERHAFRAEVDALLERLPHVHREVRYTRPGPDDRGYDATGRPTAATLAALDLPPDAEVYLCGPNPFLTDIATALAVLGLAPTRVHTEVFGTTVGLTPGVVGADAARPHPPSGPGGPGPAVTFARSDLTVNWDPNRPSLLARRSLCRARAVELPHRGVPDLPHRPSVGHRRLRAGPPRTAGRGRGAAVLRASDECGDTGSLGSS
jgi:ferredoxin-NADP reductase